MKPILLIPYRDRKEHLEQFIPVIRSYFHASSIYLIEQADNAPFNRGALFNIGFLETQSEGDYYILHDVDLIPIPGLVNYGYCEHPTHLSAYCSQFDFKLPYGNIFGGVVAISRRDFITINGFPNSFTGWGGEDDILFESFCTKGIPIMRKDCWFESLPHERNVEANDYNNNINILKRGRDFEDGLSNCRYHIVEKNKYQNYTHIKIQFQ